MDQRDIVRLQIELLKSQRTICDLSIELHTRDLAALDAAVTPEMQLRAPEPDKSEG